MKSRRIHAEHLVGRLVRDRDGRKVGRIEEIDADLMRDGCYVRSFVLGERGFLKRMSIWGLFFHSRANENEQLDRGIRWDKIDISNPKRPRLRCGRDEL
jgi:sporulation protein YlmC with PRC-barrel domain